MAIPKRPPPTPDSDAMNRRVTALERHVIGRIDGLERRVEQLEELLRALEKRLRTTADLEAKLSAVDQQIMQLQWDLSEIEMHVYH